MGLHDEMEEGKTKEADEAFNQALELKTKGEVSRGCSGEPRVTWHKWSKKLYEWSSTN